MADTWRNPEGVSGQHHVPEGRADPALACFVSAAVPCAGQHHFSVGRNLAAPANSQAGRFGSASGGQESPSTVRRRPRRTVPLESNSIAAFEPAPALDSNRDTAISPRPGSLRRFEGWPVRFLTGTRLTVRNFTIPRQFPAIHYFCAASLSDSAPDAHSAVDISSDQLAAIESWWGTPAYLRRAEIEPAAGLGDPSDVSYWWGVPPCLLGRRSAKARLDPSNRARLNHGRLVPPRAGPGRTGPNFRLDSSPRGRGLDSASRFDSSPRSRGLDSRGRPDGSYRLDSSVQRGADSRRRLDPSPRGGDFEGIQDPWSVWSSAPPLDGSSGRTLRDVTPLTLSGQSRRSPTSHAPSGAAAPFEARLPRRTHPVPSDESHSFAVLPLTPSPSIELDSSSPGPSDRNLSGLDSGASLSSRMRLDPPSMNRDALRSRNVTPRRNSRSPAPAFHQGLDPFSRFDPSSNRNPDTALGLDDFPRSDSSGASTPFDPSSGIDPFPRLSSSDATSDRARPSGIDFFPRLDPSSPLASGPDLDATAGAPGTSMQPPREKSPIEQWWGLPEWFHVRALRTRSRGTKTIRRLAATRTRASAAFAASLPELESNPQTVSSPLESSPAARLRALHTPTQSLAEMPVEPLESSPSYSEEQTVPLRLGTRTRSGSPRQLESSPGSTTSQSPRRRTTAPRNGVQRMNPPRRPQTRRVSPGEGLADVPVRDSARISPPSRLPRDPA